MTQHILSHLAKILPQEQSWKLKILREWHLILGPLAQKVVLHRVDDHAVVLAVAHPGLAQELLMLSDLIRGKINEAIGHEAITTIHFRTLVKSQVPPQASAKPSAPPAPVKNHTKPLSPAEISHLSTIANKELRDALAEFYATCKERAHK